MRTICFVICVFFCLCNTFGENIDSCQYDSKNQLIKIQKSNGNIITYEYDEVGNRISKIVIKDQITDINNSITNPSVKLYPNPTSESFYISGFEGLATLKLIDISGKVILTKQVSSEDKISISTLPKGIYIVELITKKKVIKMKLVKN